MKLFDPEKFSLPLIVVVSLLGSAAGAGGTYMAAKTKLDETAAAVDRVKADVKKAQEDVQAIQVEHAQEKGDVQARLKNIEGALERIERAVSK